MSNLEYTLLMLSLCVWVALYTWEPKPKVRKYPWLTRGGKR